MKGIIVPILFTLTLLAIDGYAFKGFKQLFQEKELFQEINVTLHLLKRFELFFV